MKLEPYDDSELVPKRSFIEAYKSIPNNIYSKKLFPITPHVLWALQFIEWKDLTRILEEGITDEAVSSFAKRLDDSFALNKALEEGRLKRKSETMVWWGMPPNLTIRADLHSASSKMIYGPSHDVSFMGVRDTDREIEFVFNIHMEEGFASDYWWISGEDEIFKRRHMKLGYRLKEMAQKFDDLSEAAVRIKDIMTDIRNEHHPEWSNSSYTICLFFVLIGITTTFSSWDALGQIHDGINSKSMYKLPYSLYLYQPVPPILNSLFALGRREWVVYLTRMLSGNQLYMQPNNREILEHAKTAFPEYFDRVMLLISYELKKVGIPLPAQTMDVIPPKFNPTTGEWETLEFKFPPGPRIFYEDLDISFDEANQGILFDITHKSKIEDKVTRENIISIGHGFNTKYFKPEGWIEEERLKEKKRKKIKKIKKIIKLKKVLE